MLAGGQSAGSVGEEDAEKSHRHCVIRAQRRASGEKKWDEYLPQIAGALRSMSN